MKTTNPTIQSVWEENDSTEQSKKFENKQIFVQNNGINATNNLFVKKECKDIGSKKKCRCDINHIGERFGKLTIIKQYSVRNKRQSELKVDYKCDCGTTTFDKSYQKVKRQKMCLKCRGTNLHKVNKETSFSMLFNDYTRNATRRNLVFDLSRDEFLQLTKQKCFYCGSIPSAIKRKGCSSGEYIYNGVDRKDNSEGYTTSNCVPCCKLCNFAKHILDRDGFLNHIKRIYDYQFVENKR